MGLARLAVLERQVRAAVVDLKLSRRTTTLFAPAIVDRSSHAKRGEVMICGQVKRDDRMGMRANTMGVRFALDREWLTTCVLVPVDISPIGLRF